jgi:hypothetical protein
MDQLQEWTNYKNGPITRMDQLQEWTNYKNGPIQTRTPQGGAIYQGQHPYWIQTYRQMQTHERQSLLAHLQMENVITIIEPDSKPD